MIQTPSGPELALSNWRRSSVRICDAVRSTVPQEMWGEIVAKLEELEQPPEALDAETEAFDDDDEPYDPTEFIDEDDEF
jgi:hypothetical protein